MSIFIQSYVNSNFHIYNLIIGSTKVSCCKITKFDIYVLLNIVLHRKTKDRATRKPLKTGIVLERQTVIAPHKALFLLPQLQTW